MTEFLVFPEAVQPVGFPISISLKELFVPPVFRWALQIQVHARLKASATGAGPKCVTVSEEASAIRAIHAQRFLDAAPAAIPLSCGPAREDVP